MGLFDSFVKNVFCDVVKPRIGSIVKVDLIGKEVLNPLVGHTVCHTGVYIGNDEIVEVTNIDGVATVQIVSAEEFIEGEGFARTGMFIYVACKQDRNGNCIAMGSKDIADRARAAVGQTSRYNLAFNNCHMFVEYCITGKRSDLSGILMGVETALDNKFIEHGYERLVDMWRSTGESRGDNPCFVDDEDEWEFEDQLTSARQGDMEAQFQVAESYYYGNGVDENEAESAKWYKKAALQGHVESMMKLGQLYYIGGDGVPENDAEAKRWYKMAADAGNREAKEKLKYFD